MKRLHADLEGWADVLHHNRWCSCCCFGCCVIITLLTIVNLLVATAECGCFCLREEVMVFFLEFYM